MTLNEFWDGTLEDVNIYTEVYQKKQKAAYSRLYALAHLTGIAVAAYNPIADHKNKFPTIDKVFPSLFEAEEEKPMDWREMSDKLQTFAMNHNKQLLERGL